MKVEEQVAGHYTRGTLEQKILEALRAAGKNVEQLSTKDLEALDHFHIGGREAIEDLAESSRLCLHRNACAVLTLVASDNTTFLPSLVSSVCCLQLQSSTVISARINQGYLKALGLR